MFNHKTFLTNEDKGSPAWKKLRAVSDELCAEHGLNVIENERMSGERGVCYHEHQLNMKKLPTVAHGSWKSRIKLILNAAIYESENFDDFLRRIRTAGVECVYKPENVIKLKYRLKGQERFTRARTLGFPYDVEGIGERIERYKRFLSGENIYVPRSKIIDVNTEKMSQNEHLQLWARVQNMKTAADIMIELERKGIQSLGELAVKVGDLKSKRQQLVKTEKSLKGEVAELKYLLQNIKMYRTGKSAVAELKTLDKRQAEVFRADKSQILDDFKSAREVLRGYEFADNRLPDVKKLEKTIENLTNEAAGYSGEAKQIALTVGELESMRKSMYDYLRKDESSRDELDHEIYEVPER
jgi:hypothetical protein